MKSAATSARSKTKQCSPTQPLRRRRCTSRQNVGNPPCGLHVSIEVRRDEAYVFFTLIHNIRFLDDIEMAVRYPLLKLIRQDLSANIDPKHSNGIYLSRLGILRPNTYLTRPCWMAFPSRNGATVIQENPQSTTRTGRIFRQNPSSAMNPAAVNVLY